jgi:hypothetical protein
MRYDTTTTRERSFGDEANEVAGVDGVDPGRSSRPVVAPPKGWP